MALSEYKTMQEGKRKKKTLNQPYSHNLNQPRLIFRWHAFFQRNAFLVNVCIPLYTGAQVYNIFNFM